MEVVENKGISASTLKIIACAAMFIDHIGAIVISAILDKGAGDNLRIVYEATRIIGRLAYPIFCFLLTEGFGHTSNRHKYFLRLIIFALLTELPYNIAFSDSAGLRQNALFTLALGFVALVIIERLREKRGQSKLKAMGRNALAIVLVVAIGCLNEFIIRGSYGFWGVAAIAVMYVIGQRNLLDGYMAGCIVLVFQNFVESAALVSVPLILLYNGKPGLRLKFAFYVFYPAHLLLLAGIAKYIF